MLSRKSLLAVGVAILALSGGAAAQDDDRAPRRPGGAVMVDNTFTEGDSSALTTPPEVVDAPAPVVDTSSVYVEPYVAPVDQTVVSTDSSSVYVEPYVAPTSATPAPSYDSVYVEPYVAPTDATTTSSAPVNEQPVYVEPVYVEPYVAPTDTTSTTTSSVPVTEQPVYVEPYVAPVPDQTSQPQQQTTSTPVRTNAQGQVLTAANCGWIPGTYGPCTAGRKTMSYTCSTGDEADCIAVLGPKPVQTQPCTSGQVIGDPQFTGLQGQSYQVHGVAGEVYNLISDKDVQLNSRFVFLKSGECPVVNGKKAKGCFSHPGSYLGELGLKTADSSRVQVISGGAATGFARVLVDSKPVQVGETVQLGATGSVTYNNTHVVTVAAGRYTFEWENSDKYINQAISVNDWDGINAHGLLGQTHTTTTYAGQKIKEIQGEVDDYTVKGGDIFGDDFMYNRYN